MGFNYNGSKSGHSQPMVEINTTPLVDVMLVLLVIFIITAPLLNQAVPVDLPKVDATRMNDQALTVQVSLDARNRIFVGGEEVGNASLAGHLKGTLAQGAPSPEMHLRADRRTHYEQLAEVMAIAQSVGITKIAFVTEAAR
ncbi:ExbD/TolR family protein [Noviherbaspirillum saxi]|uniref:Biopolymer transporter ExbD n=1 Tax=Noviherbaspirillum saxi TaxID=2320863 RepID=A0A3A3FKY9_9BURK|nr:biopolymer transporter ExbD [Noviherbaspirillum saxi]RJF92015.1 biopolymer transporter ExbD [Noviherbaspirillum saxi]